MTNQNQIKNQIESIFNKYNFTPEQRSVALSNLIKVGESLLFDKLASYLTPNQKAKFEQLLKLTETSENAIKEIYVFLGETCGEKKVNEVRDSIYDKLIKDYVSYMSV